MPLHHPCFWESVEDKLKSSRQQLVITNPTPVFGSGQWKALMKCFVSIILLLCPVSCTFSLSRQNKNINQNPNETFLNYNNKTRNHYTW